MAPKRKSDVLLESLDDAVAAHTAAVEEGAPPAKQPRVGDTTGAPSASASKAKKSKAKGKAKDTDADDEGKPKHWSEVKLDDEDEVSAYSSTNTRPRRVSTRLGRVNARTAAYVLLLGWCSSVVSTNTLMTRQSLIVCPQSAMTVMTFAERYVPSCRNPASRYVAPYILFL